MGDKLALFYHALSSPSIHNSRRDNEKSLWWRRWKQSHLSGGSGRDGTGQSLYILNTCRWTLNMNERFITGLVRSYLPRFVSGAEETLNPPLIGQVLLILSCQTQTVDGPDDLEMFPSRPLHLKQAPHQPTTKPTLSDLKRHIMSRMTSRKTLQWCHIKLTNIMSDDAG